MPICPAYICRSSSGAPACNDVLRQRRSLADRERSVQPECILYSFAQFFQRRIVARGGQSCKRARVLLRRRDSPGPTTWWFLATVDGQVHLLDGSTDQVLEKLGWGSDIASVRSGCGSGWQVLATGSGEGANDAVRAFEVTGREPVAASTPIDVSGAITAMWTESGGTGAVAVAHNSKTGRYEAFRLILTCGR